MYQSILYDVIKNQQEPKHSTYEMSIKVKPGESINSARISYGLDVGDGLRIIHKYGLDISRLARIIPIEQLTWILFGFDHSVKCLRVYFERPNERIRGVPPNSEPTGVCNEYIYDSDNDKLILLDEMKVYYWSFSMPFETKTPAVQTLMNYSRYNLTAYKKTKHGIEWYAYYVNHKDRTLGENIPYLLRIASSILDSAEYSKLVQLLTKFSECSTTWISFGRNSTFNIYFRERHVCG